MVENSLRGAVLQALMPDQIITVERWLILAPPDPGPAAAKQGLASGNQGRVE